MVTARSSALLHWQQHAKGFLIEEVSGKDKDDGYRDDQYNKL